MSLNCVILCGGTGSRLFPLSREKYPKQFLALVNEHTMLQNTILRVNKIPNIKKIILICNRDHIDVVKSQLGELNLETSTQIVTEPKGRDTAAAVAISSLLTPENEVTLVVPSDHVFDNESFSDVVQKGMNYIDNNIVIFGIKPTYPETGYGYIKTSGLKTERFVEKPNYTVAKEYLDSGDYYWNAGVFLFKNAKMRQSFERYSADILNDCLNVISQTNLNDNIIHLSYELFIKCRSISVDYAIMEKLTTDNNSEIGSITIPYDGTWTDIGSFAALHSHLIEQFAELSLQNQNIIKGNAITMNTNNCYIDTHKPIVVTIDVNNLVIVNTPDVLLVCNKDKSQDIKKIVEKLKSENNPVVFNKL